MTSNYLKNFNSPYTLNKTEPPPQMNTYNTSAPNFRDSRVFDNKFSEPTPNYYDPSPLNFQSLKSRNIPPDYSSNTNFQNPPFNYQMPDFQKSISDPHFENPPMNPYLSSSNAFNFQRTFDKKPPLPFQEHLMNLQPKQENSNYMNRFPINSEPPVFPYPRFSPLENQPLRMIPREIDSPLRRGDPIFNKPLITSMIKSPESFQSFHFNNENIPIRAFPLNEPMMDIDRGFPIKNEPLMDVARGSYLNQRSPPPMFYSHKLNEQTKENNVFPDFITAFGTYKHYDLATKESKFRKNLKKTTQIIENNFVEDMSYLNVNFLQQSHYDKVFDALKNFIFFDRSVEKIKEDLAHKTDFDIKLLFQYFDDNNSGQIVASEWKEGFVKLGISAEENDIYLMINRYSRDGNKKIGFPEFCEIILPNSGTNKEFLLKKETRQKYLSNDSQHLASKLFKMILNVSYSSELIRRDLAAEELNYKEVFNFIDFSKGGLVTKDEMKGFLNKYNFHPFNEDLDNLMGRFDRNRSGKINFKEFEYELLPKLVEN